MAKTAVSGREFIRKMHSAGSDLRKGMSRYRKLLTIESIPPVIRELARNPIYAKNLILNPFPRKIEEMKRWFPLGEVSPAIEFVWTASILSLHIKELNEFIELRDCFHAYYLAGKFDQATTALDEIERQFGYSLWSVDSRLRLLQRSQGLSAQKQYLENIISTDGIDPFAAYMFFYLSFSCEENVTTTDIARELAELEAAKIGLSLVDYFTFKMNPIELTAVRDPSECIRVEENSPLIDRFETFAQMAQVEFVRCASVQHPHLDLCFALLTEIKDRRFTNIRKLLTKDAAPLEDDAPVIKLCDDYTRGEYGQISNDLDLFLTQHPGEINLYELAARSKAHAPKDKKKEDPDNGAIYELIIAQMRILFSLQGDMIRARFELQRLAILCRSHGAACMIAAFLQPNRHAAVGMTNSEDSLVLALNSSLANPWSCEPITKISSGEWLANQCRKAFPDSISLELHECLRLPLSEAEAKLAKLDIPEGRRQAYLGHAFFRHEELDCAIQSYKLAIQGEPVFGIVGCGLPLFSCLFTKGDIAACLDLVVGQYLTNHNTQVIFPLKRLLEAASDAEGNDRFHLDLALAAQIYADNHGAAFNGLRSDAFENFLDSFGVDRPSALPLESNGVAADRLTSFLYKVCTVETLEDSTIFATYEDVEAERITILQHLIDFDPGKEEQYSNEIRQLTEDAEVALLLQEFEGSRIYVNEQGVLRPIEGELRDAFSRYKQLLAEPSLEYQAGDIRRRIKELIDRSDPKVDMSNFHLPATEREGLFRRMYGTLVDSFVLDPHYGLKTYLSTNILHGALEGELRHSLGKRGLLLVGDNDTVERSVGEFWGAKLHNLKDDEWKILVNAIGRFSRRITDLVVELKTKKIRVRLENSPEGLIDFSSGGDQAMKLMPKVQTGMEFQDFTSLLFANFWELVDRSLAAIRETLSGAFSRSVHSALDSLQATVERTGDARKVSDLLNAIVLARTEFDVDVQRVAGWFSRKPDRRQTPFSFETAVRVAIKATNNCFPRTLLDPLVDVSVPVKLRGSALDPLVYVLSNCLQNAIQRSGFEERAPDLSINAYIDANRLCVTIRNDLGFSVNLEERRRMVEDRMKSAAAGDDPAAVSAEGGSGFGKIRRSLSQDIGVEPILSATVSDSREFCLNFSVPFDSVADSQ